MTVEIGLSLESADYVRGANDAKRAVKGLTGAQDDASGSASGLGATSTTTTGKLGGLAGKAKAAAVALGPVGLGVAAGAAVVGIVKVGAAVLDMAASIEDSQDAFDAVFLEMADEVDAFAQEFGGLVGVSDRTARDFLTNTQGIIKGLGFSNAAAAAMSQTVLTLGGDLASFTGETNERAQSALKSALVGETEALKELGIVMTAAEVETRAMADSGKESAKALTQQEKAAARVHLVMEKMGRQGSLGDAARTSDSLRTQLNQLGRAWGNVRDTLVPILANVLRPVVDVIVALALKLNENRETIGRWVGAYIQAIKAWYVAMSVPIRAIIETAVDLGTVWVKVFKGDFRGAATAAKDALNIIPETIARVKGAIGEAAKVVEIFKGETEDANEAMAATAATDAPAMAAAMGGTIGSVATGAAAATRAVKEFQASIAEMPGLAEPPLRLTSDALRFMRTDAEEEFMRIRAGIRPISTDLLEIPEFTFPAVVAETHGFGAKLTGIFKGVSGTIGGLFDKLFSSDPGGILSAAENLIPGIGGILGSLAGDFAETLGFGGEAATSVGAGLQQMAELAASVLPPPAGTIAGAVASLVPVFENVVGAIGSIFRSGTDGWVEAAEAAGIAMTQAFADAAHEMGQSMDEALENARVLQEHFQGLAGQEYQLGLAQGFTGTTNEVIDQYRRWRAGRQGEGEFEGLGSERISDPTMPGGDPSLPSPGSPPGGSAPPGTVPGDPLDTANRTADAVEQIAGAIAQVVSPSGVTNQVDRFATGAQRASGGSGFAFGT